MNRNIPCVSFIGIVDFSENARWLFVTSSVSDLLGFEPHELIGTPSLELTHPDEFPQVKQMHYDTIKQDKAAVLAYLRLRHKDPYKGYVLCAISRTVVHNVLVGSVSSASPGPKAMHNASTAQEIEVITPSAKDFEFRRWNDPSPMPPSPIPAIDFDAPSLQPSGSTPSTSPSSISTTTAQWNSNITPSKPPKSPTAIRFDPLPTQSIRVALILDRFTINCTVIYCSNDNLISTTDVMGRPFFDFVSERNEELVRTWIDMVKGWGVNERGQPSDGGFGFGRFTLCLKGRDSSEPMSEGSRSGTSRSQPSRARSPQSRSSAHPRPLIRARGSSLSNEEFKVDAIFSAHSDGVMVILRRAV